MAFVSAMLWMDVVAGEAVAVLQVRHCLCRLHPCS
jgi:hypothetical protein